MEDNGRVYRGYRCGCKPGIERDNCPTCDGTGRALDFRAMREQSAELPRDDFADAYCAGVRDEN